MQRSDSRLGRRMPQLRENMRHLRYGALWRCGSRRVEELPLSLLGSALTSCHCARRAEEAGSHRQRSGLEDGLGGSALVDLMVEPESLTLVMLQPLPPCGVGHRAGEAYEILMRAPVLKL